MAIIRFGNNRYEGLTADTKPTNVPAGSIYRDTQLDIEYEYNGTSWDIMMGNTKTETLSNKTINGLKLNLAAKTANYTATQSDDFIPCAPAANMTITLPAVASSTGKWYFIHKTNSNAFTVTIDGNAAETINGAATMVLTSQYQGIIIYCDGSAWFTHPNMVERTGIATATANGTDTVFNIAHGLGVDPYNALVECSSHTNTYTYVTDATNITVTFSTAPSSTPTATIKFHWRAVQ